MVKRVISTLAMLCVLIAPATAMDLSSMTDAERTAFGQAVRQYLLENPEVIMEAVQVLEQRQAEAQAADDVTLVQTHADALFNDGYSHVKGNPDGDITIIEFVDYRCGYCRRAFPEVEELLARDGNIRLILKEFPILGDDSVLASRFAISAQLLLGDDAYGVLHDALMTMRGNVTAPSLVAQADDLGLNGEAILAGITAPEVDDIIGANHQLAQLMQISGTPTFVVGTEMLRGYLPLDGMQQVVAEQRAAQGG